MRRPPITRGRWRRVVVGLAGWLLALHPAPFTGPVHRHFPVTGHPSYTRFHHDYPATDIFDACGERVLSPVDGRVLEVSRVDTWRPATDRGAVRGGRSVSIRGADGVRYYGSHLARVRDDIAPGVRVSAGQPLGRVGHSGDARDLPCHLHFGLSPVCRGTGQWWIRRGEVNPYRFLRSWQSGGERSPVPAVAAWHRAHHCP